MSALKPLNDLVAFVIEFVLMFSVGYAGFHVPASLLIQVVLAIGCSAGMVALWGLFAAPRSTRRLGMPWLLVFKVVVFAIGVAAFYVSGQPQWGLVLGLVAAVHLAFATATDTV